MELSRKIEVSKCPLYQGDGGIVSFEFTAPRYYGETDLSNLSAVLKVRFSNETTDGFALDKKVNDQEIALTWNILPGQTIISGDAEGQVVFENEENTVVLNSQIFNFIIEPSIEMDFLSTSGETALEKLKSQIDEKVAEVNVFLNKKYVTSVNGKTDAVTITASDLSCATTDQLSSEVNKFKNGSYIVQSANQSVKSTYDGDGNNIVNTYLKKSEYVPRQWQLITTLNGLNAPVSVDLGGDKSKVFLIFDCAKDIDEMPKKLYATLTTMSGGNEITLSLGVSDEILLYSGRVIMSYRLEMCGNFAKVDKSILNGKEMSAVDFTDYQVSTVGAELAKSYIDNIILHLYDDAENEFVASHATVKVYAY